MIEEQEFNGKIYRRYTGRKYFTSHKFSIHRDVWKFYNGDIPDGMEIHHIDFDESNNDISNLECLTPKEHQERHRHQKDYTKWQSAGVEASKEWHRSDEGRKFHSEIGKKSWENKPKYIKICEVCQKEYETFFPKRSKFCHNNCKAKSLRDRNRIN
jgi:hypothetical protein